MTRNEKRLLTAIAVGIAIVCLGAFGIPRGIEILEQHALSDLAAGSDKSYAEGEWVTLDSEDDLKDVTTLPLVGASITYDVGLQFTGSVRFCIDSTRLYDDFGDAPIAPSTNCATSTSLFDASEPRGEYDLFLIDLTVENVDADTLEKTETGSPLFLVAALVSTDPLSECVYVSDYHVGGDARGESYISLVHGEKKSLTIGYAVQRADVRGETVSLSGGFKNPNKYRVDCRPIDFRPEVAS